MGDVAASWKCTRVRVRAARYLWSLRKYVLLTAVFTIRQLHSQSLDYLETGAPAYGIRRRERALEEANGDDASIDVNTFRRRRRRPQSSAS